MLKSIIMRPQWACKNKAL